MTAAIRYGDNGRAPNADWGVALLAHGSRRGSDTLDGLRDMTQRLQERLAPDRARVVMACLEFIQPDLPQAVGALVADGVGSIVVMPFLLGQGTHTTDDIEEEIGRALEAYPQARISASQTFGADPALVDIVAARVRQHPIALNGSVGAAPIGVMLVKAGTRSPAENHIWLHTLGQMLERQLGEGYAVAVAQSHFGPPTMDEAAAELAHKRGVAGVICVPYIFFPGLILTRNIIGGVKDLERKYPRIPFRVTPTLGVESGLVDLTARRILEAARKQRQRR